MNNFSNFNWHGISVKRWALYLILAATLACRSSQPKVSVEQESEPLPNRIEEFDNFVSTYWYGFDFSDTLNLRPEVIDKPFARYLAALPKVSDSLRQCSISSLLDSAAVEPKSLRHIVALSDRLLFAPNSPVRNEELYIELLEAFIEHDSLSQYDKIKPQYQLANALKNRVGERAADFDITLRSGSTTSLYSIEARYILLLFNNPQCAECAHVKEFVTSNPHIFNTPDIKVVAVYPDSDLDAWLAEDYPQEWINGYNSSLESDGLYYIQAIPTLYLLDRDKRVLLKDFPVETLRMRSVMN